MFWIREKSRMACLPFYFLKRWTYQISNGSRETDPMKLYFFTLKLGSLRKRAFSTTLNHLPYTLFRYSLLGNNKKEKARIKHELQAWGRDDRTFPPPWKVNGKKIFSWNKWCFHSLIYLIDTCDLLPQLAYKANLRWICTVFKDFLSKGGRNL